MSLSLPEQPSRNRSASTGDSGLPKHEHKRPRLSGSQALNQEISTAPAIDGKPISSQSSRPQSPLTPLISNHPASSLASPPPSPAHQTEDTTTAISTSPKSKVTINTRPLSSQNSSLPRPVETSRGGDTMQFDGQTQPKDPSQTLAPSAHHDGLDHISISSSDCGSPPIQVAELEDLDQDPADTQWAPISHPLLPSSAIITTGHVQRTFPFVDQYKRGHVQTVVANIANVFSEGTDRDDEIFQKVKTWTVEFAHNATNTTYDFFAEDRDFWAKFPSLVNALLRRPVGLPGGIEPDDLADLFVAFCQITTILVQADVQKLRSYSDATDPKSITQPYCLVYFHQIRWIMTQDDVPLYNALQQSPSYETKNVIDMVVARLLPSHAIKHVRSLTDLFECIADFFPKRASLVETAMAVIDHAQSFIHACASRATENTDETTEASDPGSEIQSASAGLLHSINATLDRAITKQQPWLSIETCNVLLKHVSGFVDVLAVSFPGLATSLMEAALVSPTEFEDQDVLTLASKAWRFTSLLKLLKKGRMEVRVACIQIMGQELVNVYTAHIGRHINNLDHPVVRFMVRFLRENNIIQYMIGVDSHPQIINRCPQIIGFLCVSQSYHNEDTDLIWQVVLESQDPRTVVEILTVFQNNFENLEIDALSHIALKLLILPIERFDLHMLDFAIRLLSIVTTKASDSNTSEEASHAVDRFTFQFCLRILREANTPNRISTDLSARIRHQMTGFLATKITMMKGELKLRSDQDVFQAMLAELCNDIRNHTEFSCGGIIAFRLIFQEANPREIFRVVQEHDLVPLLVADVIHACQKAATPDANEAILVQFNNRFHLLVMLIFHASEEFTTSSITDLWIHVLASSQLIPGLRSAAWDALGNIFEHCRVRNSTLESIVEIHLPTLSPQLYDSAVLHFSKQSVRYEMRQSPAELMEDQAIVSIPGIERVWNIMLQAPSGTIELDASQFIIEQYLDSDRVLRRDQSVIEATHLAIIDRCVEQVIGAAQQIKLSADVNTDLNGLAGEDDAGPIESDTNEMKFHRSLLFLRNFLDNLKLRPRYTPTLNENLRMALSTFAAKGNTFDVGLQIMNHKTLASIQFKWTLGAENRGSEVWQFLSDITGWSQFAIINGGKKIPLQDEQKTLRALEVRPGSFMVNKTAETHENTPATSMRATSPVDNKVMHHFDELYNLLELEDNFAKEVFDFLRMFSSQEGVLQRLKSRALAPNELLPVEKPFKLMYYARALRSCIEDESFSSEPNSEFLIYGIRTILSVLPNLSKLRVESEISTSIAQGLIEALVLAFRARVSPDISKTYIENGMTFVHNLVALWAQALTMKESDTNVPLAMLVRSPFEALVEGMLHDERLWDHLPRDELTECLQRSLLLHPVDDVRRQTLSVIYSLAGVVDPKLTMKVNESRAPQNRFSAPTIKICLSQIWNILLSMMSEASGNATICKEFFDALISIFRKHRPDLSDDQVAIEVQNWRALLLSHQHLFTVGTALQDMFTPSIGRLLSEAIKATQTSDILTDSETFVREILGTFLFPPMKKVMPSRSIIDLNSGFQQDPVVDMTTRSVLHELVLLLSRDKCCLDVILDDMACNLMPNILYFQPNVNNERQHLRSDSGYSGLRNLSNTCYLNSLISQLFMNVEFRELIMNVNIIDRSKQKLVFELGRTFAHMQKSYEDAVNPESVVDAITLWDGDQIDVTVQMDVDEFYNLLFDRLESQIVDPKVCNTFKSIYGGQLVQQIKSKECEHVSERLEPFAAVQVEIKGKAGLEESLRTYVEGEVLQGENKYSCTGCGKHVDAVKRACLKVVPDHLIFNLKRFDYDIMTGTRCKVNDEFGFPEMINMAPYTLDALSNPEVSVESDNFELVGVIIHSGTAESGHYYSYIRQRPSMASKENSWLQFNDQDVQRFDPALIRDCCFGGIDFGAVQCPKFYNGYMLFYQRASSIQKFEKAYPGHESISPIRLPIAADLDRHIGEQNDLVLRTFVAQDPTHARFVRCLVQQKQSNNALRCSDGHDQISTKLLLMALNYTSHLSGRWKEMPDFSETLTVMRSIVNDCGQCAKDVIDWLVKEDNLIDNLLRSCYANVRKDFAYLAMTAWSKWVVAAGQTEDAPESIDHEYKDRLAKFLILLSDGWEHLQRHGRGWEQYFFVVTAFLRFGEYEARAVIEAGFLELALELVHVHVATPSTPKRLRIKYQTYLLHRERNRLFGHAHLIQLLAELLQHIDFTIPAGRDRDRSHVDGRYGPSASESALLGVSSAPPTPLVWMGKVITGRHNPEAADLIVQTLCRTRTFARPMAMTLKDGLNDGNVMLATAYLQPTITFVAYCPIEDLVYEITEEALDCINTTRGQFGREFLSFVQILLQTPNIGLQLERGFLVPLVKQRIRFWAPALLMATNDIQGDVRTATLELVNDILFQEMDPDTAPESRSYRQNVKLCVALAKGCAEYVQENFLNARSPNIQAGQANQVSQVVDHCLTFFGDNAHDEESVASITGIMEEFRTRSDGVIEAVGEAEWNASSDLEAMSEADGSEASN